MNKLRLNNLDSTIKSSYRTLAIFEFFAEYKKPATVGQICRSLDIPQSSASNILRSLQAISYLSYDPDTRVFFPTMRMAFLSNWKIEANEQSAKMPSLLKSISKTLEENVVLAQRNGIFSQYIFVVHHNRSLEKHVEIGSVRPLATSATGWSLLKDESDYEIGKIIARTSDEIEKREILDSLKMTRAHINKTRIQGYAYSEGNTAKNAAGVAMNLPNDGRLPTLAIAVAGEPSRIEKKTSLIAQVLREFIAELPSNISEQILT